MSEIDGDVVELVAAFARFLHQRVDEVAEVALVLRLAFEHLAGELGDVGAGVVADAEEFDQREPFGGEEGEVDGGEFEDDLECGRVRFAEVGRCAETERRVVCWGLEWGCEFCCRR